MAATCVVLVTTLAGCTVHRAHLPDNESLRKRAHTRERGDVRVSVVVLGTLESQEWFGVPLDESDVQPIWLEVENRSDQPQILVRSSLDPNYYTPAEVAFKARHSVWDHLTTYGLASIPLLPILVPWTIADIGSVHAANDALARDLDDTAFPTSVIEPGQTQVGFVFVPLTPGTKEVEPVLLAGGEEHRFVFVYPVPGIRTDYQQIDFAALESPEGIPSMKAGELRKALAALPCCTTNREGDGIGDPLNIAIVGGLNEVVAALRDAGWYETESIYAGSAWKMAKSFLFGSMYRVSPVSDQYLFGRKQDAAFQKVRKTIDRRNHFRLWLAPFRFRANPVWVGAVTRDIGVRFTLKTWNLTTHEIDPDADRARDDVLDDLALAHRVTAVGLVDGVGRVEREHPRVNFGGGTYHTDGWRTAIVVSQPPVRPTILDREWELLDAIYPEHARDRERPVGVVRIRPTGNKTGTGVGSGEAVLEFHGQEHRFRVVGTTVTGPGGERQELRGEVYAAFAPTDLTGTFTKRWMSGVNGAPIELQNERGVVVVFDNAGGSARLETLHFERSAEPR